ncbi:MAG: c-type cytochrome [Desulfobulbaceae bacterium]|nr:c-type cytochrome [Desulfobulbaceae bacterium]
MRKCLILPLLLCAAQAGADQATAMKSGCLGCHQPAIKTVGPAIKDISAKYKGSADLDKLVSTVKTGRTGDQLTWGTVPMPPNEASKADVRKVIEWMLTH